MSLPSGKSPDLNDFNVEFYKFFWQNSQNDLFETVNNFFITAHLSKTWGLTYVALIPKIENPSRASDY